jgi:hypothetical protein
MNHFHCLANGADVAPLMNAIARNSVLWNQHDLRTTHPSSPHTEVSDIWLRFNDLKKYKDGDQQSVLDEHESANYPAMFALPQARALIFGLMSRVEGERLGRCLITKLPPGGKITPHVDGGAHAAYYDRYHIVLNGLPGSIFRCGDEQVCMRTGEVWWFDNAVEHEVINNSADDRVHLIVDIRTTR